MQEIHHKALRAIYQSNESYGNLLNIDNSDCFTSKTSKISGYWNFEKCD